MRKELPTERRNEGENKKKISRKTVVRFFVLVAVVVLTNLIYRLLLETPIGLYAFFVFLATETVLIFTYVIYNRGFSRRGITTDMLPDTMSEEEKDAWIANGEQRMKRSKWMLIPIFSLLITFLLEAMELIALPTLKDLFFS